MKTRKVVIGVSFLTFALALSVQVLSPVVQTIIAGIGGIAKKPTNQFEAAPVLVTTLGANGSESHG